MEHIMCHYNQNPEYNDQIKTEACSFLWYSDFHLYSQGLHH